MINNDVTETTTIERTYWYDINDKMVPDHGNMTAYLLDECILFENSTSYEHYWQLLKGNNLS